MKAPEILVRRALHELETYGDIPYREQHPKVQRAMLITAIIDIAYAHTADFHDVLTWVDYYVMTGRKLGDQVPQG